MWNVALAAGLVEISVGRGTSVEWIEIPLFWALVFAAVFAVVMAASLTMFARRKVAHVYVSQWYLFGAVLWFPFLYLMANVLIHWRRHKRHHGRGHQLVVRPQRARPVAHADRPGDDLLPDPQGDSARRSTPTTCRSWGSGRWRCSTTGPAPTT